MLSWGEKKVELSPDELVMLPSLKLLKPLLDLYCSFVKAHCVKVNRLGRTSL